MSEVVIVAGTQWGDEAKGKVAAHESANASLAVRSTGGNNAGHTVKYAGRKFALNIVPGALVHGVESVIGPGVVINPAVLLENMCQLWNGGVKVTPELLHVSGKAHVIFPYHMDLDALYEAKKTNPIGTTRKGIGPCYMDKANRTGIRMYDLLLPVEELAAKIEQAVAVHNVLFKNTKGFENKVVTKIDAMNLAIDYRKYGEKLSPYITDTGIIIEDVIKAGGKIVLEGAQSYRLDLDHGDYPDVTSSSPNPSGTLSGAGIGPNVKAKVIGVAKAYTSRVGQGPFPTEQDNEIGECIRELGFEFGTTTGRPRRCGWPDIVLLQDCAVPMGVTCWSLNHVDTLGKIGLEIGYIDVCVAYMYKGNEIHYVPQDVKPGEIEPVYKRYNWAWEIDPKTCKSFEDLPPQAKEYIQLIEDMTGIPVKYIGIGPADDEVIVR